VVADEHLSRQQAWAEHHVEPVRQTSGRSPRVHPALDQMRVEVARVKQQQTTDPVVPDPPGSHQPLQVAAVVP